MEDEGGLVGLTSPPCPHTSGGLFGIPGCFRMTEYIRRQYKQDDVMRCAFLISIVRGIDGGLQEGLSSRILESRLHVNALYAGGIHARRADPSKVKADERQEETYSDSKIEGQRDGPKIGGSEGQA